MKVLVAKTFGIGNAVCGIPLIKALRSLNYEVDVLVGDLPDDFGAKEILGRELVLGSGKLYLNQAPIEEQYENVICATPFDGRWRNGVHFTAVHVMDGRPRPDPSTMGFSSWKKHEIEYQMENAAFLGFKGPIPDCRFFYPEKDDPKRVYVGMGYKRDAAGFWAKKHWGNENYARLIKMILDSDPEVTVVAAGNQADLVMSLAPVYKAVRSPRFEICTPTLARSMELVGSCGTYIGNDTGMMHVAASCNRNCVAVFKLENSITKSHPWCDNYRAIDGFDREVTPEEMFSAYLEVTRGKAE